MIRIGEGDVVVGISFPRYSASAVKALQFAKGRGADIIAITDNENSPIVKYASTSLFASCEMDSFADSLVAPLSVINALIVALVMNRKDEVSRNYEELEDIWDEYDVYEKNSDE